MAKVSVERLVCSQLLSASGESLQSAEVVAKLALNDYPVAYNATKHAERVIASTTVARTGGVFLLCPEDAFAVADLDWEPTELPPLPYPRCWFEIWSEEEQSPQPFIKYEDVYDESETVLAFAVVEADPCARWAVYGISVSETGTQVTGWDLQVRPSEGWQERQHIVQLSDEPVTDTHLAGSKIAVRLEPEDLDRIAALPPERNEAIWRVWALPIVLTQLVTVLGARHVPVALPRARRREWTRRYGPELPTIYYVDLRATGEIAPGSSDRQYYHRWLVRGHYRRDPRGTHQVPGKGVCAWVRPYVKGPVGAPWKGRPIYVAGAA